VTQAVQVLIEDVSERPGGGAKAPAMSASTASIS
jgi:hypothetical protein